MTADSGCPADADSCSDSVRCERAVAAFEAAWRSAGDRPRVADYAPPAGHPARLLILAELVHADIECRLRAGETARVESYLAEYPDLAASGRSVLDLIETEYTARVRWHATPPPDEYHARFPAFREALAARLRLPDPPDCTGPYQAAAATPAAGSPGGTNARESVTSGRPASAASPVSAACGASPPGYEVIRELGRGGMGIVYLARQVALDRPVALKMILAGSHAGPQELARFRAEAEAIAQLRHPNIVQVHEVGTVADRPYFTLEFCEGGSLHQKLAGSPVEPAGAARIAEAVARGVHAAHEKGIVHRDLKPQNVLLSADGVPKVTDFGLAKRAGSGSDLTQSGAVMGTPSYMAPEQAAGRGKEVGPAADVYALGAVLYELLTGRPPFRAATPVETLRQVLSDEPPRPRQLNPQVPVDLETIATKCLQKDPARRYPSAAAFADDLRRWREGRPITARPPGRLERARKWAWREPAQAALVSAAALLFCVLVAFAVQTLRHNDQLSAEQEHTYAANTRLTEALRDATGARDAEAAALVGRTRALERERQTSHGQRIALAEREWLGHNVAGAVALLEECRPELRGWEWYYLRRLCGESVFAFRRHSRPVHALAVSSDGRWAASGGGEAGGPGEVVVWDVDTGAERRRFPGPGSDVHDLAFSPNGMQLAAAGGRAQAAVIWDLDSGEVVQTLRTGDGLVHGVAFSPDGRLLATAAGISIAPGQSGHATVWEVATGREVRTIGGHTSSVNSVAFSPDGRLLATASSDHTVRISPVTDGPAVRVCRGHTGSVTRIAFSPDGSRLASASLDNTARVWVVGTGREEKAFRGHEQPLHGVAFSPDGRSVATAGWDRSVKVWDLDSQRVVVFRGHTEWVYGVAFHPDGRRLLSCGRDRTVRVWDAGCDQGFRVLSHGGPTHGVAFSPDGTRLATAGATRFVKVWDATTGNHQYTVEGAAGFRCLAWSPDGRLLAAAGDDREIHILNARDGRPIRQLTGHAGLVMSVHFSTDSQLLVSAGFDNTVRVWNVAAGRELHCFRGHQNATVWTATFSPDGRLVASGGDDGVVRVWDAGSGREVVAFGGHGEGPVRVTFNPANGVLASGAGDGLLRLWDVAGGKLAATLSGHTGNVTGLAVSSDGMRLVAADTSRGVRLWDTKTNRPLLSLRGVEATPYTIAFSPDGQRIAAGCSDGTVRIWDAPKVYPDFSRPRPLVKSFAGESLVAVRNAGNELLGYFTADLPPDFSRRFTAGFLRQLKEQNPPVDLGRTFIKLHAQCGKAVEIQALSVPKLFRGEAVVVFEHRARLRVQFTVESTPPYRFTTLTLFPPIR